MIAGTLLFQGTLQAFFGHKGTLLLATVATVTTVEYSTCDTSKSDKSKYKSPSCTVYTVNGRKRGCQLSRTGVNFAYRFFPTPDLDLSLSYLAVHEILNCIVTLPGFVHFIPVRSRSSTFTLLSLRMCPLTTHVCSKKCRKTLSLLIHQAGLPWCIYIYFFSATLYWSEVSKLPQTHKLPRPEWHNYLQEAFNFFL